MNTNLSHSNETLFLEIVSRGRGEGVVTQTQFDDLVEEVIEEHRSVGEIADDEGTEDAEEQIRGMWPQYEEALNLGNDQPVL